MVDTLLRQWREYMESPEYRQERDRARKHRTDENKQSEEKAKVKVHSLRHQRRRCNMLRRRLGEGTVQDVSYYDKDLYQHFFDGRLDEEVDEATKIHGYGTLSTGERLGSFGPRFG